MRRDACYLRSVASRQVEFLHKAKRVINVLDNVANENTVERTRTDRQRAPGNIRKRIGMGRSINIEPDGPGLFGLTAPVIQFAHVFSPQK